MSAKKKAKKAEAEEFGILGLDEIDKKGLVICEGCGTAFYDEVAEVCPTCQGKGLNPGPDEEETAEEDDFEETSDFNKEW